MIGCDRCLKDFGCEIEKRASESADNELQAFYKCDHGLLPFGEDTEDCVCQSKFYRRRLRQTEVFSAPGPFSSQNDSQPTEFDGEAG